MEPIRIVFAEFPRMLRDMLQDSFLDEPDLAVVGEASTPAELLSMVGEGGVDVVMLCLSTPELPDTHYQLFDLDARVRILTVAEHGKNTSLYELRPYRMILGEGSPKDLVRVIRNQVRGSRRLEQRVGG